MRAAWTKQATWFAAALLIATVAGWQFGNFVAWIGATLTAFVAWQLFNLFLLETWLARGAGQRALPALRGWKAVYERVSHLRSRGQDHKRRLHESLQSYRDFAAALPDGVVLLNEQQEIIWANQVGRELLNIPKGHDGRQRITDVVRSTRFVKHMKAGKFGDEIALNAPAVRGVKLTARVIPYGHGQQMIVLRDVTRAHRVEKMRRNFVANVSHELRTPLTVVMGYLEEMDIDPAMRETWGDQIREMRTQTDRMQAIITDLLTLSRLQSGRHETVSEIVRVPGLLAQIQKETVVQYGDAPEIEMECNSTANILGSETELHSAFLNLVGNAMKYTPGDGRVTLRWLDDESGARFSVSDTGPGISPKHIPRLTERFYRVDKGRSRDRGGTGLGLAIVKHVLQRHDATLEIQSEPKIGSTFTCVFPRGRVVEPESHARFAARPG